MYQTNMLNGTNGQEIIYTCHKLQTISIHQQTLLTTIQILHKNGKILGAKFEQYKEDQKLCRANSRVGAFKSRVICSVWYVHVPWSVQWYVNVPWSVPMGYGHLFLLSFDFSIKPHK